MEPILIATILMIVALVAGLAATFGADSREGWGDARSPAEGIGIA
jgi:FlaG/FlaF family flagellin (archaellin)